MCQIPEGGRILAIDPGREKVGLAIVERSRSGCPHRTLVRKVVKTVDVDPVLGDLSHEYEPFRIVLGNGTFSGDIFAKTARFGIPVSTVDEHMTSMLARQRYFIDHPPRGIRRLIPVGMQTPPVPIDDYVAVILGERYIIGHMGEITME